MDAASKRARAQQHHHHHHHHHHPHHSKRTAEQTALCKKCSRMHSPANNQMVFCDGCNDGWHQLCHEPRIADEVVKDQTRGWFCAACLAKRERHAAKRQKLDQHHQHQLQHQHQHQPGQGQGRSSSSASSKDGGRESWAGRPPQQKRAYLLTLSQQELVGLLMKCLERHPELPIFPPTTSPASADQHHGTPRSLFGGATTEGLFPRADYVRKVVNAGKSASGKGTRSGGSAHGGAGKGSQKEDSQERTNGGEDHEFDPLAALWPKPGMGLYMRLPPDTEDDLRLKDNDDYEAFSVIVYDDRGRKVEENGMKV
jgi:hypothetical protein